MFLNTNERQVLSLLNFENYVVASVLAKQLLVSDKTVRRMIAKINEEYLAYYNNALIISQPGKGFKLSTDFKGKNIYKHLKISDQEENELYRILLKILFSYPYKRRDDVLETDYLSASAKIIKLKKIKELFKNYNLIFKAEQHYVWISGEEDSIRKAINSVILLTSSRITNMNLQLFKGDNNFIDSQVELIEEQINQYLSYPYDWTIKLYLSIIVKRVREGKISWNIPKITNIEEKLVSKNKVLATLAKQIMQNLSHYLNFAFDKIEQLLLFQTLYAINLNRQESLKVDDELAHEIIKHITLQFFDKSDFKSSKQIDRLQEDLYQHILPMISRLRLGLHVENNLLDEIKLKYNHTFVKLSTIIASINKELAFETKINEAEIGYLTLYFEKFYLEITTNKKVLLVCSTGIGTSELLKIRIKKKVPNLNIIGIMSNRQAEKNKEYLQGNTDLILTTIDTPIKEIGDIPIIMISPLLTENDIQKINYILEDSGE